MNTPFDNIYVLSLPSYKDRFYFVHHQLNDLGINHNFMWGVDFGNINTDAQDKKIEYPNLWSYYCPCTGKDFSCTINHYNTVYQAYEFGYERILIMEDDICFIKNKELIEHMFNSIPEDADFVTYDPRFIIDKDIIQFNNDVINNNMKFYFKDIGQYSAMVGGMLYAIMNRDTIKLYLDNQRKKLFMSDWVEGLFSNVKVNKYISARCICTDQYNIKNNFIIEDIYFAYKNNYTNVYDLNINEFYVPNKYDEFERLWG